MDEGREEATLHIRVECPGAGKDAINITELQNCVLWTSTSVARSDFYTLTDPVVLSRSGVFSPTDAP